MESKNPDLKIETKTRRRERDSHAENVSVHQSPATCSHPEQRNVKAQGLMQTSKSTFINQHEHLHAWLHPPAPPPALPGV